mmetsp:Transcript_5224/g.15499  ORF Transcript_5224/g.15499 Transcript_5224/m.15499 type:complete len:178 (-) Transcript_5224:360-893(-)
MARRTLLAAGLWRCAAAARPNVLFIMADDMGVGEVGAFPGEEPRRIRTPVLDALAAGGMRFSRAYAGYTVCAPSRTTLFTGVHSGHFAARNFSGQELYPGQAPTLPELFRGAGYRTAAAGKLAPLTDPEGSGRCGSSARVEGGQRAFRSAEGRGAFLPRRLGLRRVPRRPGGPARVS